MLHKVTLQTSFHDVIITRGLFLFQLIKLSSMQQKYELPEDFCVTWLRHSVSHYVESLQEINIIVIQF
jgi:isocitrate lyase